MKFHSLSFMPAKTVSRFTGTTERQALNFLGEIRKKLGKEDHQKITLKEFCEYTGLRTEDVLRVLNNEGTGHEPF